MKQIWKNILMIMYAFASLFILGAAIMFPFTLSMKDCQFWVGFIIYPLAIIVMATQSKAIEYFEKNMN